MKHLSLIIFLICLAIPLSTPKSAYGEEWDEGGVLNPEELNVHSFARRLDTVKKTDGYFCWFGYEAHKAGIHDVANKILTACASAGNHAAMILKSHLHENGYGVKKSAEKATEWVKRAAEEGYSIGQFNYGVALLKGHGTAKNIDAGKVMINKAARQGDKTALELIDANYDTDVVTPDAEQPEKQNLF